jgi:PhzF family phenazine biosynthesis protein
MRLPLYQIDAFTDRVFAGNPAAVVPLEAWLPDATLQAIAAENNLSETAFFLREGDDYALRWFTPDVEVELCGHATLATGHLILGRLEPRRAAVSFRTLKAGTLTVTREGEALAMDFPARPSRPVPAPEGLAAALGVPPRSVEAARDHVAIYARQADVAALRPDLTALAQLPCFAVVATAPGEDGIDFVSRFFAPALGIPEDPVTGSAHCTLIPYWAERLGKTRLRARQISARGGDLDCSLRGDRVTITGRCALYLEGSIVVPG